MEGLMTFEEYADYISIIEGYKDFHEIMLKAGHNRSILYDAAKKAYKNYLESNSSLEKAREIIWKE